jgi:protein-S-isoprenylcysteine O-methyltransferase Ste14
MFQALSGWFPDAFFANLYGIIVLAALLSDELVPRLAGGRGISYGGGRDRGSFILIYISSLVGLGVSVYLRFQNIGVVPVWVQGLALVLLIVGTIIREWAIALLGIYFSRTVKIEQGHRLITGGPYRWFRHPAYTGMLIMYASIVLGLGTWVGALFTFIVLLFPTLYRIQVEEKALLDTFGDEYRTYIQRTWRLFPKW